MSRTLLARVRRPDATPGRVSDSELRADVLDHLQRMCRTRQGSSPTAPLYGLPDVTDSSLSPDEMAQSVIASLKYTIETYEPRLRAVHVEYTPGEHWNQLLRFRITAQLVVDGSRKPVSFETRIDPSRRVFVD